jgi:hypothetical protein
MPDAQRLVQGAAAPCRADVAPSASRFGDVSRLPRTQSSRITLIAVDFSPCSTSVAASSTCVALSKPGCSSPGEAAPRRSVARRPNSTPSMQFLAQPNDRDKVLRPRINGTGREQSVRSRQDRLEAVGMRSAGIIRGAANQAWRLAQGAVSALQTIDAVASADSASPIAEERLAVRPGGKQQTTEQHSGRRAAKTDLDAGEGRFASASAPGWR